ncbi:3'-5' exoribonuclease [Eubacteriales bacterium OttesenSCG-928-M02]|nr:3'-5' exoribonuclease [Eubacteriales bacterium OttesenSCG-928-M02]
MDFIAIDFETASAKSHWSACAVGLVDVRDGKIYDTYYSLINPGCGFDYRCVRVHGIEEADVADAIDLHGAMALLREKLDGRTIVAHNASFDTGVMKAAMEREGVEPPVVDVLCTVSAARRAFPGRQSYSLSKMMDLVGEYEAHNALADAMSCAKLLLLCGEAAEADSVAELVEELGLVPGRFSEKEYYHCKVKPMKKGKEKLL